MLGKNKLKSVIDEKLVTPQRNTAAIAILALAVASIALILVVKGGK